MEWVKVKWKDIKPGELFQCTNNDPPGANEVVFIRLKDTIEDVLDGEGNSLIVIQPNKGNNWIEAGDSTWCGRTGEDYLVLRGE